MTETCPYAKPITGITKVKGCSLRTNRTTAGNKVVTYAFACPPDCYQGDYTHCPFYTPEEAGG